MLCWYRTWYCTHTTPRTPHPTVDWKFRIGNIRQDISCRTHIQILNISFSVFQYGAGAVALTFDQKSRSQSDRHLKQKGGAGFWYLVPVPGLDWYDEKVKIYYGQIFSAV